MSNPIKRAVTATQHLPAAILLLRIHYWGAKREKKRGWVRNTYVEWQAETGLTFKQTKDGLARLRKAKFIETRGLVFNGMRTSETRLTDVGLAVFAHAPGEESIKASEPTPKYAMPGTKGPFKTIDEWKAAGHDVGPFGAFVKTPLVPDNSSENSSEGLSSPPSVSKMELSAHEGQETGEESDLEEAYGGGYESPWGQAEVHPFMAKKKFAWGGFPYKPGDDVWLTTEDAAPLIASGIVYDHPNPEQAKLKKTLVDTIADKAASDLEEIILTGSGEPFAPFGTPESPEGLHGPWTGGVTPVAMYSFIVPCTWSGKDWKKGDTAQLSIEEAHALTGHVVPLEAPGVDWKAHDKAFPGPPYPAGHPKLAKHGKSATETALGAKKISDILNMDALPVGKTKTLSFLMDDVPFMSPAYADAMGQCGKTGPTSMPDYVVEWVNLMGPKQIPSLHWHDVPWPVHSLTDHKNPIGSLECPVPKSWPHPGLLKALKHCQPGNTITLDYDGAPWKLSVPPMFMWPPIHCREHVTAAVVCLDPYIVDYDLAGEKEWGYWTPGSNGTVYWTRRPRSTFNTKSSGAMSGKGWGPKTVQPAPNLQQIPKSSGLAKFSFGIDPGASEGDETAWCDPWHIAKSPPIKGKKYVGDAHHTMIQWNDGVISTEKHEDAKAAIAQGVAKKLEAMPPKLDPEMLKTMMGKLKSPPKIESIPLNPKTLPGGAFLHYTPEHEFTFTPLPLPPEPEMGSVFDVLMTKGKKPGKVLPHEKVAKDPAFAPDTKPKDLAKLFREAWEKNPAWGYLAPFPQSDIFKFKHIITKSPPGKAAQVVAHTLTNWTKFVSAAKDKEGAFNLPEKPTVAFLLRYLTTAVNLALPPALKANPGGSQVNKFKPKPEAEPLQPIAQDVDKPASLAEVQAILAQESD